MHSSLELTHKTIYSPLCVYSTLSALKSGEAVSNLTAPGAAPEWPPTPVTERAGRLQLMNITRHACPGLPVPTCLASIATVPRQMSESRLSGPASHIGTQLMKGFPKGTRRHNGAAKNTLSWSKNERTVCDSIYDRSRSTITASPRVRRSRHCFRAARTSLAPGKNAFSS